MQHHILIIDDDNLVCMAVKRMVERTRPEIQVFTAATGWIGLDLAHQLGEVLHLIVLDVHLPDMDGRQLAAKLRTQNPNAALLPLTGNELAIPDLLALGCEQPLLKPYPLRLLPQQIAEVLERTRRQTHTDSCVSDDSEKAKRQPCTTSNSPAASA